MQRVTSSELTCNKWRATSEFAISDGWILKCVVNDFVTSSEHQVNTNEQRVKSYASKFSRKKDFKFCTENIRFADFRLKLWKNYCHVWNKQPRIWQNTVFLSKQKTLNLGTKIPFYMFSSWILKSYCHI